MRYTKEQIAAVKQIDLLSYLKSCEPGNLRHLGRGTYCLKDHDSLKISNGKWHWFSQHIGGRNALDYLMKVRGFSFVDAMRQLSSGPEIPVSEYREPVIRERKLEIPPFEKGIPRVTAYLTRRGINREVIDYCHQNGLLFEESNYHNCVFLGYDGSTPKFGSSRSTFSDFRGELAGSDKRFSFAIPSSSPTSELHLFEAAIDAMSYATMNPGYHNSTLLSLSGVYKGEAIPVALQTYLERNPQTKKVVLHFDNDDVGKTASANVMKALQDKYEVIDEPARTGKDWNDYLQNEIRKQNQRREQTR